MMHSVEVLRYGAVEMPKRLPLDDDCKAAIKDGRRLRILENCADLIEEATENFVKERFSRSCFLAMTAIEEAGKLAVLRFFAHGQAQKLGVDPQDLDAGQLSDFLRDHPEKARQAAASSLYINAGADRRHGVHPVSGVHRTSGLILFVRSGQWMSTRNSCLYVDLQFRPLNFGYPRAAVPKELAYYMICMAHEVVAEQAASAIEDVEAWVNVKQLHIAKVSDFMRVWAASCDLDAVPFLSEPDKFRNAANNVKKPGRK